jgi:uncharacterized protein (TIGR03066 family)
MTMLRVAAALAVVCLAGAAGRAEEKVDYAKQIVGKWEVTKADNGTIPVGAVVEFTKDGKFRALEKDGDKDVMFEGTYKVDGDKFDVTIKVGEESHSNTITITKMTDTEMHTKDKDGKVVEVKRKK